MHEDRIISIGASSLQHGPLSKRVYLMHLAPADAGRVIAAMKALADENGYSKLFAKVPGRAAAAFQETGFKTEAKIPEFYPNGDTALFLSRFMCPERAVPSDSGRIHRVLEAARCRSGDGVERCLPRNCRLTAMGRADVERMAALYAAVFETYPFPIFDPDYLRQSMDENFCYFGVECGGEVVALSSCEMADGGVEMTDFATAFHWRRTGLGGHLLDVMEAEMRMKGLKTAFTIARSSSFGVNILFARAGYAFAGTLVNNTNIAGRLESMNVWYKPL